MSVKTHRRSSELKSLHTALNIFADNSKQMFSVWWTSQTLLYLICGNPRTVVSSYLVVDRCGGLKSLWVLINIESNRFWMSPVLRDCFRASVRTHQHELINVSYIYYYNYCRELRSLESRRPWYPLIQKIVNQPHSDGSPLQLSQKHWWLNSPASTFEFFS